MSEEPAPYWVNFPRPHQVAGRRGWSAAVIWQEVTTGLEVRAESGTEYSTYAEALLASQELGEEPDIRNQLERQCARTLTDYWRRRAPWLLPEEDRPT